jgi:hypothetical protein
MTEWTDAQIRILIDERRNRNDEFHDLGRDRKSFWNSIAVKINRETGTTFNDYQCKEKFSNLVWDYNVSYYCTWRTAPIQLVVHFVSNTNMDYFIFMLCVILCLVKVKPEVEQVHDILMNFVHIFGRELRMNSIESVVLILLTKDEIEVVKILHLHHLPGKLNVN